MRSAIIISLLLLQLANPVAWAAASLSSVNSIAAEEANFYYENFLFQGQSAVYDQRLNTVASSYKDRLLTLTDLQELADQLTKLMIDEGYFLSRALIPTQDLSESTLTIQISEGYISKVQFSDLKNENLAPIFKNAKAERPARYDTYQRALLKINSMPGLRVKEYRQIKDPDTSDGFIIDLEIKSEKYLVTVNLSNRGQRNGEDIKAYLGVSLNSVIRKGDVLRAGFITKPRATEEFQYYTARYDTPLLSKPYNLFAETSYSKTKPISTLAGRNLAGETTKLGIGIRRTLTRELRRRMWLEGRLDIVDAREEEDLSRLYHDRLRVIRAAVGYTHLAKKRALTNIVLEASHGLDAFNASNAAGIQTSRQDADAQFTKLFGEIRHRRILGKHVTLRLGGVAQVSDNPLLFSEEFSLGGGNYGRAYDFGEILGDSGLAGFVEFGYRRKGAGILKNWEAYSFLDSGTVWNEGAGLSIDGDFLSSAGLGLKLDLLKNLRVTYEAAQPLSDAPFTIDDDHVRHRVDLTLNVRK